jgi:hypothetical protein
MQSLHEPDRYDSRPRRYALQVAAGSTDASTIVGLASGDRAIERR